MFSFETLDVLIGLATIYMMFGIACTAAVEAIASYFRIRSTNLETALGEMFPGNFSNGKSFVDQFYTHPLIQSLSKGDSGRPSYIPSELVSRVAQSVLLANTASHTIKDAIDALSGTTDTNRLKGLLTAIAEQASHDLDSFRFALENQFDAVMDRASGWYKRNTQLISLIVAALLVILANIDSVEIAAQLSRNPAARQQAVEYAKQQVEHAKTIEKAASKGDTNAIAAAQAQTTQAQNELVVATKQLAQAGLPLGWQTWPADLAGWFSKLIGLLTSIFAISLGAPFWFSVLQRFMQVRAAGLSPDEKEKNLTR